MTLRLNASDEFMHDPADEKTFNESMYFNFYDQHLKLGGFFRLGNRPNEQYAEQTICLYLPDNTVAFMFKRPEITSNNSFDADGLKIQVIKPFEELSVDYVGSTLKLANPLILNDPKEAFLNCPQIECTATIKILKLSLPYGGEPAETTEIPGNEFARGHYEQLIKVKGAIKIGSDSYELNAYGLRDHSWGPRTWQALLYYRWLTGNFTEDFGFMASNIVRSKDEIITTGFVWQKSNLYICNSCTIDTTWDTKNLLHKSISVTLKAMDKTWNITGEVFNIVPLRNRRKNSNGELLTTRISEGMTRWKLDNESVGYGLSEYLDQINEGIPSGYVVS